MRIDWCLAALATVLLAGCAETKLQDTKLFSPHAAPADAAGAATVAPKAEGYKLTAEEEKLDCPKLTGRMKVRMANMRAAYAKPSGTATGQTLQKVVTPVFGGGRRGADAISDLQLDRAKLDAFNRRLAEKKCKTLDIDAELRGEAPATAPPAKKS